MQLTAVLAAATFLGVLGLQSPGRVSDETPGQGEAAYYPNCDAARAAGAAPLYRGEPGYRAALDRDSDGVACEPFRQRW